LGIATSVACRGLTQLLGLKCRYFPCVSHKLPKARKAVCAELARFTLRELAKQELSSFGFFLNGDESRTVYDYDNGITSVDCWDRIVEIECPSHFQQKTTFTVFSMQLILARWPRRTLEFAPNCEDTRCPCE
jgi:hypothetical protein